MIHRLKHKHMINLPDLRRVYANHYITKVHCIICIYFIW